jgi:predicted GH43/DUF377 family glycosyl hydrolase
MNNPQSTPSRGVKVLGATPCLHRGRPTGEKRPCGSCKGSVQAHLFKCAKFGSCSLVKAVHDDRGKPIAVCHGCTSRVDPPTPGPRIPLHLASRVPGSESTGIVFDEHNLHPGFPGKRFNPAMIPWGNGYAMAWRHGWMGCEVFVTMLDWHFRPVGNPIRLNLHHEAATYGREDPRFFWFRGQLHICYTGVIGGNGPTNVLYARLSPEFKVEEIFHPVIPGRNSWEKSHQYFEYEGTLYAVYSFAPHKILRIDGNKAEWAYETPVAANWQPHTEIRGGAAPVLVGNEWWSFMHSRVENPRVYWMGLYTFEAKPPFRVSRMVLDPLLWADTTTRPADQYCSAIFPCGAFRRGDEWIISAGEHDRWSVIHRWSHAELEKRLVASETP